jgi:predicted nuclease of predicted toxin-antitoxin system
MSGASDREILDYARRDNRTVVTLDADFHALMALSNARSPSVVRIRIEGLRAERLADLVARVLSLCQTDLEAGAMVTVEERRVRVRSVPLLR